MTGRTVIVTSEQLGPAVAGPGLRAEGLARGLVEEGLDVVVAARRDSVAPPGLEVAPLDALSELVAGGGPVVVPAAIVRHLPALADAAFLCVDFAGPSLVEALWMGRERGPEERRHDAAVEGQAAGHALAGADLILCAHPRQRDLLAGLLLGTGGLRPDLLDQDPSLGALVATVPFGVPAGLPEPREPPRDARPLRLIWPGGLWDWLDPETLVRGVAEARTGGVEVRVALLGTRSPDPLVPPPARAVEAGRLVRSLGLERTVTLVDWAPRAEHAKLLAAADLAVTLDPGGLEARFAFRSRLLHALWAGLPTITTAGEWMGDVAAAAGAGWTVPAGDAGEVAALLGRLDGDRAAIVAARERAQDVAAPYRYEAMIGPLARWCRDPVRRRASTVAPGGGRTTRGFLGGVRRRRG